MKIRDLLAIESIDVHASAADKNEIIRKAIDLMEKSGKIAERAPYEEQVYNREKESTTGVGMGIAIPHGRSAAVKQPGLAAMVIPDGVDYDSLDGQPVNLLFLIAAPEAETFIFRCWPSCREC
ncbi:MAG: PTS sugar transporter subunit IIA [Allobaculum sp.]|uniref:PTS sugar transporter subunit IIA n=1 Tax=Allobaculum TaxID=174708 RepID=UPI0034E2BB87